MNLLGPVKDIMTTDLVTLPPQASIAEAKKIFKEKNIHHIPVTYGGELKGMFSKTDFYKLSSPFISSDEDQNLEDVRLEAIKLEEEMTTGIATLEPSDKINVALEIFKVNMFHAIPVVSNGRLKGIITPQDIITTLAKDKSAVTEYNH